MDRERLKERRRREMRREERDAEKTKFGRRYEGHQGQVEGKVLRVKVNENRWSLRKEGKWETKKEVEKELTRKWGLGLMELPSMRGRRRYVRYRGR